MGVKKSIHTILHASFFSALELTPPEFGAYAFLETHICMFLDFYNEHAPTFKDSMLGWMGLWTGSGGYFSGVLLSAIPVR